MDQNEDPASYDEKYNEKKSYESQGKNPENFDEILRRFKELGGTVNVNGNFTHNDHRTYGAYVHGDVTGGVEGRVEAERAFGPGVSAAAAGSQPTVSSLFKAADGDGMLVCLLTVMAVLQGLADTVLYREAERLQRLIKSRSPPPTETGLRWNTGRSRSEIARMLHLESYRFSSGGKGALPTSRLRFSDQALARLVLLHAWTELVGIEGWDESLRSWLGGLAEDDDPEIRLKAGIAAGFLLAAGVSDLDGALLHPWLVASNARPLDALNGALVVASEADQSLAGWVQDTTMGWAGGAEGVDGYFAIRALASGWYGAKFPSQVLKLADRMLRSYSLKPMEWAAQAFVRLFANSHDKPDILNEILDILSKAEKTGGLIQSAYDYILIEIFDAAVIYERSGQSQPLVLATISKQAVLSRPLGVKLNQLLKSHIKLIGGILDRLIVDACSGKCEVGPLLCLLQDGWNASTDRNRFRSRVEQCLVFARRKRVDAGILENFEVTIQKWRL